MYESVGTEVVCKAISYLIKTPLYKKYNIKINNNYLDNSTSQIDSTVNFIIDQNDGTDLGNTSNNDLIESIDDNTNENDTSTVLMKKAMTKL